MPSRLVQNLSPFHVMEVLEKARLMESRGIDVIHFEVGEPDLPTPAKISDAAIEAIRKGNTKYSQSLGLPQLRTAIANDFRLRYGIEVESDRVVVTLGSSPAIFLTVVSIIEPGDEVIIIEPHYPCYPEIVKIAGGKPVMVKASEEEGFQVNPHVIENSISKRTKAIIINSPSNPTGMVTETERFREICGICECRNIYVISDEIYHGLEYGVRSDTVLNFTNSAFVVNGFSKLYSMTGWRLGYCVVPEEFVRPIQKLQQNLFISANSFVQEAGVAALLWAQESVSEFVKIFDDRRRVMIDGLRSLGFNITTEPNGAFYVFVNASFLNRDSLELAFDMLQKAHVAVTPGIDFGSSFNHYLRFAYTRPVEEIKEGIERLGWYLKTSLDS